MYALLLISLWVSVNFKKRDTVDKKENTKILVLILQIRSHQKIETMDKDNIFRMNYF